MATTRKIATLLALGTLTASAAAFAQTAADRLPPGLLACADEVDVMQRLSCYDREMALLKATPVAERVQTPIEAPLAPPTPEPEPVSAAAEPPPAAPPASEPVPVAETAAVVATEAVSSTVAPVAAATVSATGSAMTNAASPPAATASPAAEPASAPAPEPTPDPIDDFGRDSRPDEIQAVVTDIRKRPYGEMVIRLDNGQIWEQKHVDRRFRLRVGETVTISKGAVSGYRLSGDSNASIQVERRN